VFKSLLTECQIGVLLLLVIASLASANCAAQGPLDQPEYLPHSHAHNDYEHASPLIDSLTLGYASIEADVWLVEGQLCVAHNRSDVDQQKRLDTLYLDPLFKRFQSQAGLIYKQREPLLLLVDFKSEGASTYEALKTLLAMYRPILTPDAAGNAPAVEIVISGNRPIELIRADADRLVSIDGRLKDVEGTIDSGAMPLISDNWRLNFKYNGQGEMTADERVKLREIVKRVHAAKAKLRFWATPESETLWKILREEQVDFIGTDQLEKLARFLRTAP
jgi:hypothetical protein